MASVTNTDAHTRWKAMVGLATFVASVGVVSWLVTGHLGRAAPTPATASSIARTSPSQSLTLPNVGTLAGVTCVSAGDCWAVGSATSARAALILHYTGSNWAIVSTPNPTPSDLNDGLNAVTCVNAGDCWAVGSSESGVPGAADHSLVEHYAGSRWAKVAAPDPRLGPTVMLNGVACVSAGDCWAVGYSGNANETRPLIEHFSGTRGTIVSAATPTTDPYTVLNGVACAGDGQCWAAGYSGDASVTRPLIEQYEGSRWVIVDAPNPTPGPFVGLNAVTCVSRDCWAVGSSGLGNPTLFEHVTGNTWAIDANSSGVTQGASCISVGDCWMVGDTQQPSIAEGQPLIAHYNGQTLTVEHTSNPLVDIRNESGAILNGVSCVSVAECWAVGAADISNSEATLIERYTGSNWRVISDVSQGS